MRVIGMISGTSFDAIEAVAAELELEGETLVADLRGHVSAEYPPEVRSGIAASLPPAQTTIEDVCKLDTAIGRRFAEVAAGIANDAFGGEVDVICSHGQTVYHWVDGAHARGTLQLGQPAFIAEQTGATVVGDVRARDIAAGGHGAPLASLLDVLLLGREPDRVRGSLNLGGISNVTVVGPGREPLAYDIGPANALTDAVVAAETGGRESWDEGGARAARGTVDEELLATFLAEPYYELPPPKSTGKELFHLAYVREKLNGHAISTDDLLATLTALSAETVAADLKKLGVADVVAAGGGTRNPTLMGELTRRLPGLPIETFDVFGIPEAGKEAFVFAIIGFLTVHRLPATVPSCTGAGHASILGAVVPGSAPLRLQENVQAPDRLVVRTPLPQ